MIDADNTLAQQAEYRRRIVAYGLWDEERMCWTALAYSPLSWSRLWAFWEDCKHDWRSERNI